MTIMEALAALTPHYPTQPICIKCQTWRFSKDRTLEITFSVWNGTNSFEAKSLELAVRMAIDAITPKSATIPEGQAFLDEAAQLTQQPA